MKLNHKQRIELTDTLQSAIIKMAEGNPGALTVCMQCIQDGAKIDPHSALAELGALLHLDACGIYGPRIWMLYKDVCGESIQATLGVLRANQLGFISQAELDRAIDNYGEGLDLAELRQQVTGLLPRFQWDAKED